MSTDIENINLPNSPFEYLKMFITSPDYPIWFLFTLFLYSVIFAILWEKAATKRYRIIFTISIFLCSLLVEKQLSISVLKYYYNYIVYYACGIILGLFSGKLYSIKRKYVILVLLLFLFVLNKYTLCISTLNTWFIAFICIDIIFIIVQHIYNNERFQVVKSLLEWLGRNSMEIYLVQLLFLNIGIGSNWIRVVSIFVSCTCICTLIVFLLKKNKYLNGIFFGEIIKYEDKSFRLCS